MSGTYRRAEIVRDFLREFLGDGAGAVSKLIANAVDTAHPGPRLTLGNFARTLENERRAGGRELLDAFLATTALDGTGHGTWAFIKANGAVTQRQRADQALEIARAQQRAIYREREHARATLARLDDECAAAQRKVERAERMLALAPDVPRRRSRR